LRCLDVLQRTGADNVGGAARTKADGYWQRAIASAYHSHFSVGGARFHKPDHEGYVDTVAYGCWRKSTFERFGYFDEELVRNQDDEHNLRITRGGGKVYQSPRIRSWYRPRSSLLALFTQYMQYGYWKVRVIQKHKLPASWRHLVPGAFLFSSIILAAVFLLDFLVPGENGLLSTVGGLAMKIFRFAIGAYMLALLVASIATAAKTEWKLLPVLPLVFGCYHFGYGYGFLRGVWDFLVWRRRPQQTFQSLTR
jgi:succinoglycan biosynthesis protein ExoA